MKRLIIIIGVLLVSSAGLFGCNNTNKESVSQNTNDEVKLTKDDLWKIYSINSEFYFDKINLMTNQEENNLTDDEIVNKLNESIKLFKTSKKELSENSSQPELTAALLEFNETITQAFDILVKSGFSKSEEAGELSRKAGELMRNISDTYFKGELPDSAESFFNASNESSTEENSNAFEQRKEFNVTANEKFNGLNFIISDVLIGKATKDYMLENNLTTDGLVSIHFQIDNSSNHDFTTYPDQAELVINGQQINADLTNSDNIGGSIYKSVKKEGNVFFLIPNIGDVNNINELRLKWLSSDQNTHDTKEHDIVLNSK
ncbi:hypothetical protein [Listeria booriae]|uniref:hypothetical protein n=1 Tax=Listeria booriae TaxID=1552123 RepID=UPI001626CAA8|nr:hypothetical protein [Listeria booriae]MBC2303423.1 hypothetical protein [Listeria booriae]